MKKLTLLLFLTALCHTGWSQKTQLTFDVSASYQPDNYFFPFYEKMGLEARETFNLSPVYNAELGIRDFIGSSSWFYEANLIFNYIQIHKPSTQFKFPDEIDPYYGFVLETNYEGKSMEFWERYYSGGFSAGVGYRWQSKNRKKSIAIPVGVKSYYTFGRKKIAYVGDEKSSGKINKNIGSDDKFEDWLYYGLYLSPSYEFALTKKRTPWSFAVFADANVLWDNIDIERPIFLFGGGLGVRYQLGMR